MCDFVHTNQFANLQMPTGCCKIHLWHSLPGVSIRPCRLIMAPSHLPHVSQKFRLSPVLPTNSSRLEVPIPPPQVDNLLEWLTELRKSWPTRLLVYYFKKYSSGTARWKTHRTKQGETCGAPAPAPGLPPSQHLHVFSGPAALPNPFGYGCFCLCFCFLFF